MKKAVAIALFLLTPAAALAQTGAASARTSEAVNCHDSVMRAVSRIGLNGAGVRMGTIRDDERAKSEALIAEARSCALQVAVRSAREEGDNEDLRRAAKAYLTSVTQVMDQLPGYAISASVPDSQSFAERIIFPSWRVLQTELVVDDAAT